MKQGNNARDVEATEVQGDIFVCDSVRADTDTPICIGRLLGLRRFSSQPLQRLLSPPQIPLQGHGRHSHAHPPSNLIIIPF